MSTQQDIKRTDHRSKFHKCSRNNSSQHTARAKSQHKQADNKSQSSETTSMAWMSTKQPKFVSGAASRFKPREIHCQWGRIIVPSSYWSRRIPVGMSPGNSLSLGPQTGGSCRVTVRVAMPLFAARRSRGRLTAFVDSWGNTDWRQRCLRLSIAVWFYSQLSSKSVYIFLLAKISLSLCVCMCVCVLCVRACVRVGVRACVSMCVLLGLWRQAKLPTVFLVVMLWTSESLLKVHKH